MKAFIAATFITTMQKERIVAFPRQNGYFKASQCYVISTLLILFSLFFILLCMETPFDTRYFAGAYFFNIHICTLIYPHSAILLLPYYNNHSLLLPTDLFSYLFSSPVDSFTCCVLLNLSQRLHMT